MSQTPSLCHKKERLGVGSDTQLQHKKKMSGVQVQGNDPVLLLNRDESHVFQVWIRSASVEKNKLIVPSEAVLTLQ